MPQVSGNALGRPVAELREITILGVHPVEPTAAELDEALEVQWGTGITGDALREATRHVREHFANLYLVEVQLEPPDAVMDWAMVTQPDPSQPESNWQVAYDEQPLESAEGRWVFFLHFINFDRPLATPVGQRGLPFPSPRPPHLATFKYELP